MVNLNKLKKKVKNPGVFCKWEYFWMILVIAVICTVGFLAHYKTEEQRKTRREFQEQNLERILAKPYSEKQIQIMFLAWKRENNR